MWNFGKFEKNIPHLHNRDPKDPSYKGKNIANNSNNTQKNMTVNVLNNCIVCIYLYF